MIWRILLFLLLCGPAFGQSFQLPKGALQTFDEEATSTAIGLPFGPAEEGEVPVTDLSGLKSVTAWHVPKRGSSLQLAEHLERQLQGTDFTIEFKCSNAACGGYDFRYALDLVPAASMRVDLRDFHYLLATRGTLHIALMTSGSVTENYLQIIQVSEAVAAAEPLQVDDRRVEPSQASPPAQLADGFMILAGLEFDSGSARISSDPRGSVAALAEVMTAYPNMSVILVGHSDATGSLDANIALSRARALSVQTQLIETFNISGQRLNAEGVGYLAPRTSNATAQSRELNRRVEAVFLNAN